jgi:hypothetical protein
MAGHRPVDRGLRRHAVVKIREAVPWSQSVERLGTWHLTSAALHLTTDAPTARTAKISASKGNTRPTPHCYRFLSQKDLDDGGHAG